MNATRYLVLDLDAPLMSFGGPRVDGLASAYPYPTKAFVTGLIANAVGWDRRQVNDLAALQAGIGIASAVIRRGEIIVDYQTADLSKPHMGGPANKSWTPNGVRFSREGSGGALGGKRQQWRPYVANARILVAVWETGGSPIGLEAAAAALREPHRFVYLGRSNCPPSGEICLGTLDAASPREAMERMAAPAAAVEFVLPYAPSQPAGRDWSIEPVAGERDWRLDRHTGTQLVARIPATQTRSIQP